MSLTTFRRRVVIVEDRDELRASFALVINNTQNFSVIATYATAEACIKHLNRDQPEIILMDINLPGLSGIDATSIVRQHNRHCKVIMLTVLDDSEQVFAALRAGAHGYITKDSTYVEIVKALDELIAGGSPLSSAIARIVVEHHRLNPHSPLTKRETEVLKAVSVGKSFSEISEDLHIARETVKTHVHNIYTKLKVSRKSDALAMASREKWI